MRPPPGGELAETELDTAVRRLIQLATRTSRRRSSVDVSAHHALARRAAAESIVLLKNTPGVLPLTQRRVCVVGEFARTPRFQGAGSSQVNPTRVDSPLDELRRALPDTEITFADRADEAAGADVVVAFAGLPADAESEGFDRTHLDLPAEQTALLERLLDGPAPVVVVLTNGSAVLVTPWHERAAAVLECWLGGQAAGGAVADVLTGAVNPSGRLTETIPLRLQDNPAFLNFPGEDGHVRYGEGVFAGYRGYDARELEVAYPFGHGLSYTTFEHTGLTVTVTGGHDTGDLTITAAATVRNTGAVTGAEVVQLYVADPVSSVARPPRELRRFAKVVLDPGASTTVEFTLGSRDLAFWSARHHRWLVEGGDLVVEVGASSRDIRCRATIHVEATPPRVELTSFSTLEEWLADPVGGPALTEAIGSGGILADAELRAVLGNFPLSSLATFTGLGITNDVIRRLVQSS